MMWHKCKPQVYNFRRCDYCGGNANEEMHAFKNPRHVEKWKKHLDDLSEYLKTLPPREPKETWRERFEEFKRQKGLK